MTSVKSIMRYSKLALAAAVTTLALSGCGQQVEASPDPGLERLAQVEQKVEQLSSDLLELRQDHDSDLEGLQQVVNKLQLQRDRAIEEKLALQRELRAADRAEEQAVPESYGWDVASSWVQNDTVALKVDSVQVVRRWEELGDLIRVSSEAQKGLEEPRQAVASGEFKVVLVKLAMKNLTDESRVLGRHVNHNGSHHWYLHLRGEEGSEKWSRAYGYAVRENRPEASGARLTHHLQGGFPEQAAVAPGAIIEGVVAYVVPSWYEPAVLFTNPKLYGTDAMRGCAFGSSELVVKLK